MRAVVNINGYLQVYNLRCMCDLGDGQILLRVTDSDWSVVVEEVYETLMVFRKCLVYGYIDFSDYPSRFFDEQSMGFVTDDNTSTDNHGRELEVISNIDDLEMSI